MVHQLHATAGEKENKQEIVKEENHNQNEVTRNYHFFLK
jgi:hypothetical protein